MYLSRLFNLAVGEREPKRRRARVPDHVGVDPLLDPDFDDMDPAELLRALAPRQ